MDKEWLKTYYKSLGWDEKCITDFLQVAKLNEQKKDIEMKEHKTK